MKKILLIATLFLIGKAQATTYYSQVTGTQNMSILSNWDSNPGGGGTDPSNFTTSGDLFIIQSGHSITLSAALTFGSGVNLQIEGSLNPAANALTMGGTTSLTGSGVFNDGHSLGVNTFTDLVTLSGSSSWGAISSAGNLIFQGGVTNNSSNTFNSVHPTFNSTSTNQNISGTGAFLFTGVATVASSKTVTNLCSNASGVTMTGTLDGQNAASEWINAAGTILNYGNGINSNAPMLTGKLTASASGNIVNYNRTGGSLNVKGTTYAKLKISGGGTKVAGGQVKVSEELDLVSGILNSTAANYIEMLNGSSTTIGSSSSYVNGQLRYEMAYAGTRTLNFPIGSGSDWRPIILTITHSANTGYTYRADLFNASAQALGYTLPGTVDKVSKAHYWRIGRFITGTNTRSSSANLSGNQIIQIYYDLNDNVPDASNLTICKNTDASLTTWFDIGGTGATNYTGSVTSTSTPTAFSSFTTFTLGNRNGGANPLPVTLVSFTASCNVDHTFLEWTTATEINNNFFEVQSSVDGLNWNTLKTVKKAGNSSELLNYSCELPLQSNPTSFYRLKQTDFDGKFEYSDVIVVRNCKTELEKVSVYPNPSNGIVNCSYNGIAASIESVNIYSITGKLVYTSPVYQSQIDLTALPAGIYFAHFTQIDNQSTVHKIVLEK